MVTAYTGSLLFFAVTTKDCKGFTYTSSSVPLLVADPVYRVVHLCTLCAKLALFKLLQLL